MASVDFYGAFGIYPSVVRVTLQALSMIPMVIAMTTSCVREISAAVCLLSYVDMSFVSFIFSRFALHLLLEKPFFGLR